MQDATLPHFIDLHIRLNKDETERNSKPQMLIDYSRESRLKEAERLFSSLKSSPSRSLSQLPPL